MRRLLLFLVAMFAVLGSSADAAADESEFLDGEYVYTFENGSPLTLTCSGGACTVRVSMFAREQVDLGLVPVVGGQAKVTRPSDFSCDFTGSPPTGFPRTTWSGTFTPTSATVVQRTVKEVLTQGPNSCTYNGFVIRTNGSILSAPTPAASPSPTPEPTTAPPDDTAPDESPAAPVGLENGSGGSSTPSVLSTLPRVQDIETKSVLLAAALTVILTLLTAFPTSLLNSAVDQGSERIATWWRARRGDGTEAAPDQRWWWAFAGVFAAAVIGAFVDPGIGFNAGSLRLLVSLVAALALDVVVGWFAVALLVHRVRPDAVASYSFRPVTLLIVVAAVVFTRITGFTPGIVFGLVAGVAFAAVATASGKAKVELAQLLWAFFIGLVGWIGYSLIGTTTSGLGVFASETLSALAVGGMAALPITLFPVRGLAGATVFAWSRRAWALTYALGLLGFFIVLMPMPFSWDDVDWSLGAWVGVYLAYLVVAVIAYLTLRGRPEVATAVSASDD